MRQGSPRPAINDGCVLIVDDEAPILALVRYNLENAGYRVLEAADGQEAMTIADEEKPDIIILDWMLPSLSGMEVCRRIRRHRGLSRTPIIMLTARGDEEDRVRGLDVGADDYMSKPFSPSELLARIRAVLRRIRPSLADDPLTCSDLVMDRAAWRVMRGGNHIHLGPKEFAILRFLMENPGRVFSRGQLLDRIWGNDIFIEERTVDVHIGRLRKALNASGGGELIRTVRSAGYALDADRRFLFDRQENRSGRGT